MRDITADGSRDFSPWRSIATCGLSGGLNDCIDLSHALAVAEEVPIAVAYNGFSHAVMMGTPADLQDFAVGFSLSEGIAAGTDDIRAITPRLAEDGMELDITLAPACLHRFLLSRRVRALRGHTSCGICGIEELAQIHQPISHVLPGAALTARALRRALASLREFQPLSRSTRGAHAAAWATPQGEIVSVREDVGRHNALDKLTGACLRAGFNPQAGFCLITSRCSYEMAQKAIAAGISTLVAISAPTALAIRTAQAAGLTMVGLDRHGEPLVYARPTSADPARSAANEKEAEVAAQ
jgi:FdhD protein